MLGGIDGIHGVEGSMRAEVHDEGAKAVEDPVSVQMSKE